MADSLPSFWVGEAPTDNRVFTSLLTPIRLSSLGRTTKNTKERYAFSGETTETPILSHLRKYLLQAVWLWPQQKSRARLKLRPAPAMVQDIFHLCAWVLCGLSWQSFSKEGSVCLCGMWRRATRYCSRDKAFFFLLDIRQPPHLTGK